MAPLRHLRALADNDWPTTVDEARTVQLALLDRVERSNRHPRVRLVAGVDVGFEAGGAIARGAVALLRYPSLKLIGQAVARRPVSFPYVPGYLSFREVPVILEALAGLGQVPHLVLCDGQGIAHPRRFGLASHLGVVSGLATVGVAKSRLIGSHREPASEKGRWAPLMDAGERIGAVLRSRAGARPLYVSIGHRIDLRGAIHFALACCGRFRQPETTRHAHRLASVEKGAA